VDENALRSCGDARTWNDESVADLLARDFPGEAVHGDDARLCRRPSDAIGNGGKGLVTGTALLVERDKGFTDMNCLLGRAEARQADARTIAACLGTNGAE